MGVCLRAPSSAVTSSPCCPPFVEGGEVPFSSRVNVFTVHDALALGNGLKKMRPKEATVMRKH